MEHVVNIRLRSRVDVDRLAAIAAAMIVALACLMGSNFNLNRIRPNRLII